MKHRHNYTNGVCTCGLIPPHILESIARHGTESQRALAQKTLDIDRQIRLQRAAQMSARSVDAQGAGAPHKNRRIYTASNTTNLPGTLVRNEGQSPSGDVAVDEAYDGLGATFDLYASVYGRNSIDDNGMDLIATVHYDSEYDNAFWDGTQMVFGDGDGAFFNRFTIAIDVMGHELTHGVTAATAMLEYHDQTGALNESISDVFGSLVKQRSLGQTAAQADWLIGAGLFTANINGVALRSMKAPGTAYDDPLIGKDPQPDHMSGYVNTSSDNGGVHINSGIPNKAFYLAATALGGNAWDVAGHIWYRTLLDSRLSSTAQFQDFANLTVDNANRLYGASVRTAVAQSWSAVGINVGSLTTSIPFYRYWNSSIGDHFYTTSWTELGSGKYGWAYEKIQCYVYPTQVSGTVPLYRYWNNNIGDHFYTTSWTELGSGKYGWAYEKIQCYVGTSATQVSLEPYTAYEESVPATFRIGTSEGTLDPTMGAVGSTGLHGVPSSFTLSSSTGPAVGSSFMMEGASQPSVPSSFATTETDDGESFTVSAGENVLDVRISVRHR